MLKSEIEELAISMIDSMEGTMWNLNTYLFNLELTIDDRAKLSELILQHMEICGNCGAWVAKSSETCGRCRC